VSRASNLSERARVRTFPWKLASLLETTAPFAECRQGCGDGQLQRRTYRGEFRKKLVGEWTWVVSLDSIVGKNRGGRLLCTGEAVHSQFMPTFSWCCVVPYRNESQGLLRPSNNGESTQRIQSLKGG
jgi:hypothetical protein